MIADAPPAPLDRPWVFGILAALVYLAVMAIPLSACGWDISHFIAAGDRHVDAAALPSPIEVRHDSDGYDGQFYYSLAVDPNARTRTQNGVTFDAPAWRMQRIGYPVLAYLASAGQPRLVPFALFLLNILGIFVVAFTVRRIQQRYGLPGWMPWAMMLWPGFIVTLVHDTTEIAALAFLAAALDAYLARRIAAYGAFAALTALTRETSIMLFGGIALYEAWHWVRAPGRVTLFNVVVAGAAILPFLAWRQFLILRWGISPQAEAGSNMGLPFRGMAQTLWEAVSGTRTWAIKPLTDGLDRVIIATSILVFLAAGIRAAIGVPGLLRRRDPAAGVAIGWVMLAATMTLLSANGPWIDTTAYFRAFSEYWLATMIVLAASRLRIPPVAAIPAALVWAISIGIMT